MSDLPDAVFKDMVSEMMTGPRGERLRRSGDWHHPTEAQWIEAMVLIRDEMVFQRQKLSAAKDIEERLHADIARLTRERDEARTVYANRERFLDTQRDAIRLATIEECAGVCQAEHDIARMARARYPVCDDRWLIADSTLSAVDRIRDRIRALAGGAGAAT